MLFSTRACPTQHEIIGDAGSQQPALRILTSQLTTTIKFETAITIHPPFAKTVAQRTVEPYVFFQRHLGTRDKVWKDDSLADDGEHATAPWPAPTWKTTRRCSTAPHPASRHLVENTQSDKRRLANICEPQFWASLNKIHTNTDRDAFVNLTT